MCFTGVVCSIQCTEKQTSQKHFPKNRWYQSDVIELKYTPTSIPQQTSIKLKMSYVHGFQFAEIPLELYITSPIHQIENWPFTLELFDDKHNEKGDCIGDYCDIEYTITSDYIFSQNGVYTIQVLNTFQHAYLPNVFSTEIIVEPKLK
jgi:gliding motility-associated lipoprotein GldH